MTFDRSALPDPTTYFENLGLVLKGVGKWRSTSCVFHGGSDSMRINLAGGGWCCMSCGRKGGDILAYEMQAHDVEFVQACKQLGCWLDDGHSPVSTKPAPLPPRQALAVMRYEALLVATAAGNIANGVSLTDQDRKRVLVASNRIMNLAEAYE
jgi:hypothetical protein